jgi:hypothetical protein
MSGIRRPIGVTLLSVAAFAAALNLVVFAPKPFLVIREKLV